MGEGAWYFTSPWDHQHVRRGDALGFRGVADYFANMLAPGLSNRTYDTKWISILCWCLYWSEKAWRKSGNANNSKLEAQRNRYEWLRPLELMWIARTLEFGQTTGQLHGIESIKQWSEKNNKKKDFSFSMKEAQLNRYRQVGMYGSYRILFKSISKLAVDDGWTLGETGKQLAILVNKRLPENVRLQQLKTQRSDWSKGRQSEYWLTRGWSNFDSIGGRGFLPTRKERLHEKITSKERSLLAPVLFEKDSERYKTAEILSKAKKSRTHLELCEALAKGREELSLLPAFSGLADAAMNVMRSVWEEVKQYYNNENGPTVAAVVKKNIAELKKLEKASENWLAVSKKQKKGNAEQCALVDSLANKIKEADGKLISILENLINHHQDNGGGLKWMKIEGGKFVALMPATNSLASDYRFRLLALSRLAAQCAVFDMQNALSILERNHKALDEE